LLSNQKKFPYDEIRLAGSWRTARQSNARYSGTSGNARAVLFAPAAELLQQKTLKRSSTKRKYDA
jgi:hypothetical protein